MRQSFTDFTKRYVGDSRCAIVHEKITDNTGFVTGTDAGEREDFMTENLKDFAGVTLLADIGNGTMNLMYLNNGRPMESKAWTEKLGVFQCFQKIHNMVQDNTGDNLMEDVIDNILRSGKIDLPEPHASLVEKAICDYVEEIFQKLRDHEYNEKLMKAYFMGGGARLVEQFGNYNPDTTIFNHDIRANAKGILPRKTIPILKAGKRKMLLQTGWCRQWSRSCFPTFRHLHPCIRCSNRLSFRQDYRLEG